MNHPHVVTVNFEHYQGGYLATCKSIKGLFITHRDLARVYRAVPTAIKMWLRSVYGCEFNVTESMPHAGAQPIGEVAFVAQAA
jgi:hypothetical protein